MKLQPLPRPPTLLSADGPGPASGFDELQVTSPGWGGTGDTAKEHGARPCIPLSPGAGLHPA